MFGTERLGLCSDQPSLLVGTISSEVYPQKSLGLIEKEKRLMKNNLNERSRPADSWVMFLFNVWLKAIIVIEASQITASYIRVVWEWLKNKFLSL